MADVEKKQNWFLKHKLITGIMVIIVIFIIGGSSSKKDGNTEATVTPSKQPVAEITYDKVETKTLISEFDDNQLTAESKYKDKYLELKGVIKNISEDIAGSPFISIEPPAAGQYYMGTTIKCTFKKKEDIMNVKNKEAITLRGQLKSQTLGIISFDKCSIVN